MTESELLSVPMCNFEMRKTTEAGEMHTFAIRCSDKVWDDMLRAYTTREELKHLIARACSLVNDNA